MQGDFLSYPSSGYPSSDLEEYKEYILKKHVYNKLKTYEISGGNIILSPIGFIQKNYINNPDKFNINNNINKSNIINKYIKHNRWFIKHNVNDENIGDRTLKYALQAVGCLYTINFDDKGPIFVLHKNKDYVDKYGSFFDNCRIIDGGYDSSNISLIWWLVNITDYFNLLFLYNKKNNIDLSKETIYLNILDNPIVRADGLHPFTHFRSGVKPILINITERPDKPIYTWSIKKDYLDIALPFPDIWMFLLEREYSETFNISSYNNLYHNNINLVDNYITKNNKAIFRGAFTNCVDTDLKISNTLRIKAHIKTLKDKEQYLDSYVVKSSFDYNNYTNGRINITGIDYMGTPDKFMKPSDQIRYKCVLNLDGFASAWRIIQELYYNSCIICPETDYKDIIKNCLKPWIHYVPCNKDLSNLIETIKWCVNNNDKVLKIIENLRVLRDHIVSIDNMLIVSNALLFNPSNELTLSYITNFNVIQNEYKPDILPIQDDIEAPLEKIGILSYKDDVGNESLREVILL